jgi:hypothetical protein
MKTQTLPKIILSLAVAISLGIVYSPTSKGDNLYGDSCGDKKCTGDETCQKTFRGVLPIQESNPNAEALLDQALESVTGINIGNTTITPTFTCVKPPQLQAPESPYKGVTETKLKADCAGLPGSGIFGFLTGAPLLDAIGNVLGNSAGLDANTLSRCTTSYNNINQIIDTDRLIAPLPVDIFNPLPLPTNIVSPNPLPVVVVDDLALYQQKELVDAPLAAQQKARTLGTVIDNLRSQTIEKQLVPSNYQSIKSLGFQFGALDPETGVVTKEAVDKYGNYQNFSLSTIDTLTQQFKDLQNQESLLPDETFTENCGNVKIEEAGSISMFCALEALKTNNNPNDLAATVYQVASDKSLNATDLLDKELRDGSGFFSKAKNDEKNPFLKDILTPGSNIQSLIDKVLGATVDQTIIASGDNCFEAVPENIIIGALSPTIVDGLFGKDDTKETVIEGEEGAEGEEGEEGAEGEEDKPEDKFFYALQDSLLENLTSSISCEMNNSLSGLLNDWIVE